MVDEAVRTLPKPQPKTRGALGRGTSAKPERVSDPENVKTGGTAQVLAVIQAARISGLLDGRSGRIGGRVSPRLVQRAKQKTGIETDTDLIAFALANVALEDDFAQVFKASRGLVDPALKLGY